MGLSIWRKASVCILIASPVLCLAGIPLSAQQTGTTQQSDTDQLADAARKAREQKKETPKPKKVYTNEDIGQKSPVPAEASTAEAKGPAEGDAQAAAATNAQPKDEEIWRKRFKDLHAKIALGQKELDVLQRELEQVQVQFYPDPQKAMEEQYTRKSISEKQTKIEAKKQELDGLKQRLSDLEDELRKSGGDPGWARE
jgi:predicted RNase H-like nuclease (RuvC/YqgF family)